MGDPHTGGILYGSFFDSVDIFCWDSNEVGQRTPHTRGKSPRAWRNVNPARPSRPGPDPEDYKDQKTLKSGGPENGGRPLPPLCLPAIRNLHELRLEEAGGGIPSQVRFVAVTFLATTEMAAERSPWVRGAEMWARRGAGSC
jgi:hypothetical protein